MNEIETVQAFLEALERFDFDRAIGLCADDVVYQNVPLPPARGKRAVEKTLRGFEVVMDRFEARIQNIASNGPIVLTERIDVLAKGPLEISPWVCGTFEVRNERIVLWRDYFDWANVTVGLLSAAPRALFRAFTQPKAD